MKSWLGRCHLYQSEGADRVDYEAVVAVFCAEIEEFDGAVRAHLDGKDMCLLWSEARHPAGEWLARNPSEKHAADLARTVHEHHPVEIGTLTQSGEAVGGKAQSYLQIEEHKITPLPDQTGIPFWDKEWIAPELKELLFGQPKTGETLRTYFIVDAILRKKITKLFDLDTVDVPVKCLFKGDAAVELKEAAPYLVDMTLPDGAWDDKDLVPSFHKDFFEKHWGENTGIFIRSTANMDAIWNHFRKFTRVQVEEDKRWVFFRFWDPRIAPSYFDSVKNIPDKSAQWFKLRDGQIDLIAGNQEDTQHLWQSAPNWTNLEGIKVTNIPMLSDGELEGFTRYRMYNYEKRAMKFFRGQFPKLAQMLDDEQLLKVVRLAYENAKKRGITSERDHFKYLIIVAYWGSYFETDPQYQPLLKQAGWMLEGGSISQHTHLPTILREIDKHTISTATDLASFKRISSSLREIYTQPIPKSISPAIMLKIMEYIWPAHLKRGNTQGFINLIKNGISKGKNLKLPTRDTVAYICLSVYFGDRFDESPLFYWVKLALENDGRNIETRREAFWSGVAEYFDKLS